jgi:hypothetical protein
MRFKSFIIPEGKHRSTWSWRPFFSNKRTFKFIFNRSTEYYIGDNQDALNKLVGFSDGGLNHHKNSFRLAWRYNPLKKKIELFSYTYVNGEREARFLTDVPFNTLTTCEVRCLGTDVYRILINGYMVFYEKRSTKVKTCYKHMLYPYFGGTVPAPHYISMSLSWK